MSRKRVVVEGCTLQVVPPATGRVEITGAASARHAVDGKGVYCGPLRISVTQVVLGTAGTAVPGSAQGVIVPTAITTLDGQAVVRAGDRVDGLVAADAQMPSGGGPVPSPVTFSVEIVDAGQQIVDAI